MTTKLDSAEQAKKIITRLVTNCVSLLHTRHLIGVSDGDDIPTEEELINDAIGIALDEDIGCGDESELCEENSDLIWLAHQLMCGAKADESTWIVQRLEEHGGLMRTKEISQEEADKLYDNWANNAARFNDQSVSLIRVDRTEHVIASHSNTNLQKI